MSERTAHLVLPSISGLPVPESEMTDSVVSESLSWSKAKERSELAGALQSSVDLELVLGRSGHCYHNVSLSAF